MESEALTCPEWTRTRKEALPGAIIYHGDGAYVCQTGVGREAAQRAVEAAFGQLPATIVLSVGLAGGLAQGIAIGDVFACTHVDHESHKHSDEELSVYSDQALLDAALAIDPSVRTGTSLTVDEAAWGPAEKAEHHGWKAHDIVEMESFWIAAAASKRGLPFAAVRSISDASGDSLPNLGVIRPDGSFDQAKFLDILKNRPEISAELSVVAQNSRLALDNLARFLDSYLPSIVKAAAR